MIKTIVYKLRKNRIIRIFSARFVLFNVMGKQIKWSPKTLNFRNQIHAGHKKKGSTQSPLVTKSDIIN